MDILKEVLSKIDHHRRKCCPLVTEALASAPKFLTGGMTVNISGTRVRQKVAILLTESWKKAEGIFHHARYAVHNRVTATAVARQQPLRRLITITQKGCMGKRLRTNWADKPFKQA
jgi:hypothetical protein